MKYLHSDLKVYEINCGELFFIVANNEKDAENYFLDNYNEDGYDYSIREIKKADNVSMNMSYDKDLLKIINRYRHTNKHVESINIIYALYWTILEAQLQRGEDINVPFLLASSLF